MKQFLLIFCLFCGIISFAFSQKVNIVFIGNSITQGFQLSDPQRKSPPAQTASWLEKQNIGTIAIRNCGVSGKTTVDFLPASNTYFPKVKAAADELTKSDGTLVFSIMLGTNDSALRGTAKSRLQPQQYFTNMKAIVDELLRLYPNCKVVLNRPIWYSPTTHNSSTYLQEGLDVLKSYFPELKKLEDHYWKTVPGQVFLGDTAAFNYFENNTELFIAENGNSGIFYLHPNPEGARRLGEFWGKAILYAINWQPAFTEYPMPTVAQTPPMSSDSLFGMTAPSLRVYLPDPEIATGRMVIALPGGGYQHLAVFHEGYDWAPFFLSKGIAFAVLKYRMPNGNRDIPFADVRAAFAFVRQHAAEWKVDPSNIGIMGSSAGGHLASTFATHTTAPESPAFQILLYPVITMDPTFTHAGSRKNLLGDNPSREIADLYSNEKRVTAQTPRAFIIFAADDQTVPPSNGFRYAEALQKNKVALTFLLYPKGGHGFGNRDSFAYKQQFMCELSKWLGSF